MAKSSSITVNMQKNPGSESTFVEDRIFENGELLIQKKDTESDTKKNIESFTDNMQEEYDQFDEYEDISGSGIKRMDGKMVKLMSKGASRAPSYKNLDGCLYFFFL